MASADLRDRASRQRALAWGAAAEQCVLELLQRRGWALVERNWRGGGGELDLVVCRDGALRIVEVKARAADDPVGLEAISAGKQRRLRGAARSFLAFYEKPYDEVCFMVALVEAAEPAPRITIIDDAFDG